MQLLANFALPHPDNRVEYEFWYTSSSEQALDFIKNFDEYHHKFKEDVYFTPRFVAWNCSNCHDEIKEKHCFSGGQYCAFHFDNLNHTGREILYENLREKCLHDILQNSKDEGKWWDYMHWVHTHCRNDISEDCSKRGMDKLELSYNDVNRCVLNSFEGDNHTEADNLILAKEAMYWRSSGPHFFPAVIINNVTYRGFLNPEHVFEAICNGFQSKPAECQTKNRSNIHVIEGLSVTT